MAYKILYIEDQSAESRESDLRNLGYNVVTYDPPKDLGEILSKISTDTNALILDYRLTKGENNICFDAPTIAQTIRTKYTDSNFAFPIVLMSNENVITDYYKDFTSQDLFDFVITKKQFNDKKNGFSKKLNSFICAYKIIKSNNFEISKILDVSVDEISLINSRLLSKLETKKDNTFALSNFIFLNIIRSVGLLIGEDVLSARLGISKDSKEWSNVLISLDSCRYTGIFSDVYSRWWMNKIEEWWKETIHCDIPLRRLNALERVVIIKENLSLINLTVVGKTPQSQSTNFWTICKYSKMPIDPFDGVELLKDYFPWQEKEYLSIDSALEKIEEFKNEISSIDKKAIRELAKKINENG